jgi:hypothetical protein
MLSKYIIYVYENSIMNPSLHYFKRGVEKVIGLNLIKVHYMHVCEYHSEILCAVIYDDKDIL